MIGHVRGNFGAIQRWHPSFKEILLKLATYYRPPMFKLNENRYKSKIEIWSNLGKEVLFRIRPIDYFDIIELTFYTLHMSFS